MNDNDSQVTDDYIGHRSLAQAGDISWMKQPAIEGAIPGAVEGATKGGVQKPSQKSVQPIANQKDQITQLPIGQRIINGVTSIAKDIGTGIADAPRQIAGGLVDYGNNLMKFADKIVKNAEDNGLPNAYFRLFDDNGKFSPKIMSVDEFRSAQAQGKASLFHLPTTGESNTVTGNIIRAGTSFLVGRGNIAAKGGLTKNALADFVSGATGQNPDQERLSNIIDKIAPNFVTDFLKAKPGDEGKLLSNLKSGMEYSGLGMAFEGVKNIVGYIKDSIKGISKGAPPAMAPAEAIEQGAASEVSGVNTEASITPENIQHVQHIEEPGVKRSSPVEFISGETATSAKSNIKQTTDSTAIQQPADHLAGLLGMKDDLEEQFKQERSSAVTSDVNMPESQMQDHIPLGDPKGDVINMEGSKLLSLGEPAKPETLSLTPEMQKAADDYLAGKTGVNPIRVNLARITNTDNIRLTVERVSSFIENLPSISHGRMQALSDASGISPQDVLEKAQGMAGETLADKIRNANVELLASRMVRDSSAKQLGDYAIAATAEGATPEAMETAVKAFATHVSIQQYVEGAQSEAGRLLNAQKILSSSKTGYTEAIKRIIGESPALAENGSAAAEGVAQGQVNPELKDLISRIADLGDSAKIDRFVGDATKQSSRGGFMKVFYNSLLSPQTIIKKTISDVGMGMWNLASRYAAEKFGPSGAVTQGETSALLNGYISSFKDALGIAKQALLKGESQLHQAIGDNTVGGFSGNPYLDYGGPGRWEKLAEGASDAIPNNAPTQGALSYLRAALPTSWIAAVDDFATFANYRGEKSALAFRNATQRGLEGGDLQNYIDSVMDKASGSIHEQALANAQINTFKEPLTGIAENIKNIADNFVLPIAHSNYEIPIGRIVMPFVKVPVNIVKTAYRNSPLPLAFPSAEMSQVLSTPGAARDIAMAKIGMGTAVSMAGISAALSGQITGKGPSDPQLQRAWREAGNEPYTIKIGDYQYSYNNIEPLGITLGVIADSYNVMKFAKEEDAGNMALSLVFGVGKAMLSRTYLQGISDVFDTLDNPERKGGIYFDKLISSIVVPNTINAIRKAQDPWIRQHYDLLNSIENKLPYLSQGLPPMRTLWGNPIPVRDGYLPFLTGTALARGISPISVTPINQGEPIDKWIWENRMAFPQGPDNKLGLSKPGVVQTFSAGPHLSTQVQLTPQQHDRLQVLAGNEMKDSQNGLGAKDTLNSLVTGSHPSDSMQRQWDQATPAMKAIIVQNIVNKFRTASKQQLINEDQDLREALQTGWHSREEALIAQ